MVGYGNADGSVIERLDFTASGDWVPGGATGPGYYHDADADFDVDLEDVASFAACFDPAGGQASPECLAAHDYDDAGVSDGVIDLDDFTALTGCYAGPYVTPGQDCARPSRGRSLPESGTYALHGRPVDVLSDGLVLVNFRARTYLPAHARFLQRDPTGYTDGNNLYEAFGSNPLAFGDPYGSDSVRVEGDWLTYVNDDFTWDYARIISADHVLIDHPEWPYAFVMRRDKAISLFGGSFQPECNSMFEMLSRMAETLTRAWGQSEIEYLFDKRVASLGWFRPSEYTDAEREIHLDRLGQLSLEHRIQDVKGLTQVAFTINTGLLSAPGGVGAALVDAAAAGIDVASGDVSARQGALIIVAAAAGGRAFYLSLTDDAITVGGRAARGAARKGGIGPVRVGRAGEAAAGITGPKVQIKSRTGTAKYRIPDEVTEVSLREIKNAAMVSNTAQLRDYLLEAQATGRAFILEVRQGTQLRRPLQKLVDEGLIDLRRTLP